MISQTEAGKPGQACERVMLIPDFCRVLIIHAMYAHVKSGIQYIPDHGFRCFAGVGHSKRIVHSKKEYGWDAVGSVEGHHFRYAVHSFPKRKRKPVAESAPTDFSPAQMQKTPYPHFGKNQILQKMIRWVEMIHVMGNDNLHDATTPPFHIPFSDTISRKRSAYSTSIFSLLVIFFVTFLQSNTGTPTEATIS